MKPGRNRGLWAGAGSLSVAAIATAIAERRHLARLASDPEERTLARPPSGRALPVRSADGTELHAQVFGPEQAQTIVLAHGWTESLAYWTYLINELGPDLRIVAYDLRGHGDSGPASGGDYSIDRFGEDLEAVLEASLATGQRAVVAGHSLGAMSIAAWAQHHDVERRANAAALLNTGVGELMAEQLLIPVPWIAHLINRVLPPASFAGSRATLPRFSTPLSHAAIRYVAFGPVASPAQVAFYERMLVGCPPDVRADVGIALSELELHHALPRLTVPTAVLAGTRDRLTPSSHAERIAATLPHLHKLIVLPDTGHMAPLERPREVAQMLRELAASVASGPDVVAA